MRTLDEVLTAFAYHPATPDTARDHDQARGVISECAEQLWEVVPDGPDKTLVMRKLQEALFYANFAIAMQAPIDTFHPAVARVLPPEVETRLCSCGRIRYTVAAINAGEQAKKGPDGIVHTTVSCHAEAEA